MLKNSLWSRFGLGEKWDLTPKTHPQREVTELKETPEITLEKTALSVIDIDGELQ